MKTDKTANKKGTESQRNKFWSLQGAHTGALARLWRQLEKTKGERRHELLPVMEKAIWRLAEIDFQEAMRQANSYADDSYRLQCHYQDELSKFTGGGCRYYPSKEDIEREERVRKEYPGVIKSFEELRKYFEDLSISVNRRWVREIAKTNPLDALDKATPSAFQNENKVDRELFSEMFDLVIQQDPAAAFKIAASIIKSSSSRTRTAFGKFVALAAQRPDLVAEENSIAAKSALNAG